MGRSLEKIFNLLIFYAGMFLLVIGLLAGASVTPTMSGTAVLLQLIPAGSVAVAGAILVLLSMGISLLETILDNTERTAALLERQEHAQR
jgi:hypothetical protein